MKCKYCGVEIIPTMLESLWHEVGETGKLFPQYCHNMDTLHEPDTDTERNSTWENNVQDVPI